MTPALARFYSFTVLQSPNVGVEALDGEGRGAARCRVFFGGYAARGYEDLELALSLVRNELERFTPDTAVFVSGGTAAGIGAAYSVAREMGFQLQVSIARVTPVSIATVMPTPTDGKRATS